MPRKKTEALSPVGKKIKKARTEKKITLEGIANETGYAIDYLKMIEAGKKIPPVGTLLTIARALKVDSGYFLRDNGSRLTPNGRKIMPIAL